MNWDSVSHYEILQVAPTAPLSVIKASYKALIQQYHPDRYQPADEAERISRQLNEAYAALSDPDLRAAHDSFLSERSSRREPPPAAPPRGSSPRPVSPEEDSGEMGWWGRIAMLLMLLFSGYIGAGLLGGGVIPYLIGAGAGGVLFGLGRKWWIAWNAVGKAALLIAWLAICLSGTVFKQMRINEGRTPLLAAATSPPNEVPIGQQGNGSALPPGFVLDEPTSLPKLPPGFEWEDPGQDANQKGQSIEQQAVGWTQEVTGSSIFDPFEEAEAPRGTRYSRLADGVIVRLYPPGRRPGLPPANPFALMDSTTGPPPSN